MQTMTNEEIENVDVNNIKITRIPSEGLDFKLMDVIFHIKRVRGFRIEAFAELKDKKIIIKQGDRFMLFGTKYIIRSVKNKTKLTIKAVAI